MLEKMIKELEKEFDEVRKHSDFEIEDDGYWFECLLNNENFIINIEVYQRENGTTIGTLYKTNEKQGRKEIGMIDL